MSSGADVGAAAGHRPSAQVPGAPGGSLRRGKANGGRRDRAGQSGEWRGQGGAKGWLARWGLTRLGLVGRRGANAAPRVPSLRVPAREARTRESGLAVPLGGGLSRFFRPAARPVSEDSSGPKARSGPTRDARRRKIPERAGSCPLLCRLHMRLVRWMVRTTWRCWRAELGARASAPARGDDLTAEPVQLAVREGARDLLPWIPVGPALSWRETMSLLRPVLHGGTRVSAPRA